MGAYFIGTLNPLALLLLLLGLEAKIYSVRFNTPFAQMPWTRMAVTSFRRGQFHELLQFYRRAHLQWTRTRLAKEPTAASLPSPAIPEPDSDFCWGISVWAYVGLFLGLAFLQRMFESHISFDDYVFAPLYLGIVFAAALRSRRDAAWGAVLGPVALLTVKFPATVTVFGLPLGFDGQAVAERAPHP